MTERIASTLDVVVGAMYGSEAKGALTQDLTVRRLDEFGPGSVSVVRVAGPNAGHTGYDKTGRAWPLRQVPVAAVVDGEVTLGISAGSEIDLPVLVSEIEALTEAGLLSNKMLVISGEATLITDEHKQVEADGALVSKIGSTGKGIGAARADRIMRKAKRLLDDPEAIGVLEALGAQVFRSPNVSWGSHVIIEGTQGYALGLHAGYYPQCTSSDARAVDFCSLAGISPWEYDGLTVWAVARVFPIRVAGNSGPLKDETSWSELGLPEEKTTVTKLIRRVGGEDWDLVSRAVTANGGRKGNVKIALTMLDQKFTQIANQGPGEWPYEVFEYIAEVQRKVGAPIGHVRTGPDSGFWTDAQTVKDGRLAATLEQVTK